MSGDSAADPGGRSRVGSLNDHPVAGMSHRHEDHDPRRPLRWERYDPGWLVELARREEPHEPWLAEALARCTRAAWECSAYLRFVSREEERDNPLVAESYVWNPGQSEELVIDVLHDGRIGGVEFTGRL